MSPRESVVERAKGMDGTKRTVVRVKEVAYFVRPRHARRLVSVTLLVLVVYGQSVWAECPASGSTSTDTALNITASNELTVQAAAPDASVETAPRFDDVILGLPATVTLVAGAPAPTSINADLPPAIVNLPPAGPDESPTVLQVRDVVDSQLVANIESTPVQAGATNTTSATAQDVVPEVPVSMTIDGKLVASGGADCAP